MSDYLLLVMNGFAVGACVPYLSFDGPTWPRWVLCGFSINGALCFARLAGGA